MTDTDALQGVSDDEIVQTQHFPAVLINRMVTQNLPVGMRITLGEVLVAGAQTDIRFAMVMAYEDVATFRDLLTQQLAVAGYQKQPVSGAASG